MRQRVFLVGDLQNLGDAFLAMAEAQHFTRQGEQCTLLPYARAPEPVREEFRALDIAVISIRDNPIRALRACLGAFVHVGGGHVIRENLSAPWLVFAWAACLLGALIGRGSSVVGAGVSPVAAPLKKFLVARLFAACKVVSVRDATSLEYARQMSPKPEQVRLCGDVAFLFGGELRSRQGVETGTVLISPACDPSVDRASDFIEILDALDKLHALGHLQQIIFVPHDIRENFDLGVCRNLLKITGERYGNICTLVERTSVQGGLIEPYSQAEFVITERLHGLIAAALTGSIATYTSRAAQKLAPFGEAIRRASDVNPDGQVESTCAPPNAGALLKLAAQAKSNFD